MTTAEMLLEYAYEVQQFGGDAKAAHAIFIDSETPDDMRIAKMDDLWRRAAR